ncbi:paraquat-inducible protein A [Achromobacter sp. GG226]|nr:paraquat-inducible protein A [Verticiella sp. GG226]
MANCARCDTHLWRASRLDAGAWLALALAGLLVLMVANVFPIASLAVQGQTRSATLFEALVMTWQQGREGVALMAGLTALGLPLLQILLLLWVLAPLTAGRLAPGFRFATRLLGLVRPWCMVPVLLLGVLVSLVKLAGLARLQLEAGFVGLAVLSVLGTQLSRLSPHVVWRLVEDAGLSPVRARTAGAGERTALCHVCGLVHAVPATADHGHTDCPRCDAVVHWRKPDHVARTWALLVTAALLYIPANVWPVMEIRGVLGGSNHTILGGVIDLWKAGSWDLAVIVFVASVAVPMTKLLALVVLLLCVQRGMVTNRPQRTRLYRVVEFIGQWSMLDVYVVVLLGALANFPGLMQISTGPAAGAFGLVVVLTMLAAMSFDPRAAWDVPNSASSGAAPRAARPLPVQEPLA